MRRLVTLLGLVLALPLVGVASSPSPARAAACQSLSAGQIRVDAPHLTGGFSSRGEESCYAFSAPPGTAMQFSWYSGVGRPEGNFVDVVVTNATGGVICSPQGAAVCRLAGLPPYRVTVTHTSTSASRFDLQMFRLTGDPDETGCTAAVTVPFGGDQLYSTEVPPGSYQCWTYHLQPGYKFVRWTGTTFWRLTGATGDTVCEQPQYDLTDCRVPAAGRYTLLMRPGQMATAPVPEMMAVVDLADRSGCHEPVDTAWNVDPVTQRMSGRFQVDCWPFAAQPGDQVVPQVEFLAGEWDPGTSVVDADGRRVCLDASDELGCTLEGSPPYRFITWGDADRTEPVQDYRAAVRSLSSPVGCPQIEPTAYGTWAEPITGIQCRQFVADAGDSFDITSVGLAPRDGGGFSVIGADHRSACWVFERRCSLTEGGRFLIYHSDMDGTRSVNLHDRGSTAGCQDALGLDLGLHTRGPGPAQVDCLTLGARPGERIVLMAPEDDGGGMDPVVIDGAGRQICSTYGSGTRGLLDDCELEGPMPFRVTVGPTRSLAIAAMRRDAEPSCRPVRPGEKVTFELDATQRAGCLVLSGVPDDGTQLKLRRDSGAGRVAIVQPTSALNCGGDTLDYAGSHTVTCSPTHTNVRRSILMVIGDGVPAGFRLVRSAVPGPPPYPEALVNVIRPRLAGTPVVGSRLKVRPGTWNVHPSGYDFLWFVGKRRLDHRGPRLKLAPRMVGRRISVVVVALRPDIDPGYATTRSVRVRRR